MYTEEFYANPHPTYARLRAEAPVNRVRDPNGLEYWLVSRYDEARAALADERLSKDPRRAWDALRAAGMVSGEPGEATFDLHSTDPPDHTRLRALVAKGFTAGRVERLRPRVGEIAADLLSSLAGRESADLVEEFAYPLSLTVIAELLGVPVADRDRFRAWTMAAITPAYVAGSGMSREEAGRLLRSYAEELVAAKRPGEDDLLSALIAARDEERRLTTTEIVVLTQQLLFAGHEPSTNLIGNALAALLTRPEERALLRDRPELLPRALEELLRYDGPTVRASPRYATEDLELGGVRIPAGSVVVVGLAAANRDPSRFADPDRLDLARADNPHLAFGHGIHRCLGAPLARAEAEIAIGMLLRQFPGLTLACPAEELTWLPHPVFAA